LLFTQHAQALRLPRGHLQPSAFTRELLDYLKIAPLVDAVLGPDDVLVTDLRRLADHDGKNLLRQIVGISPLQGMPAQPVADLARIQIHEPLPRLRIGLQAQSFEQADGRVGQSSHSTRTGIEIIIQAERTRGQ